MLRVALWQARLGVDEDADRSMVNRLRQAVHRAKELGADLLVAPEMSCTGYNVQPAPGDELSQEDLMRRLSMNFDSLCSELAAMAKEANLAIVAGLPRPSSPPPSLSDPSEQGAAPPSASPQPFNSAVFFDKHGDNLAVYDKTHLFGSMDRRLFSRGGALSTIFEFGGFQLALAICYDVEFPEVARSLALKGAEILLVPTANMEPAGYVNERVVRVRAEENHMFICYANFAGVEGNLRYVGQSSVNGPDGSVLAQGSCDQEELLLAELDRKVLLKIRSGDASYLNDRRPDLYA